jgi:flagellar hook-basal body complex protein FliE
MTRTDHNSNHLTSESSMNLDAMDMDLDLLDDLELDVLEFDTTLDQTIRDDNASYKTKGSSRIRNSSERASKRALMSKAVGRSSKRKLDDADGQHDETSLLKNKPKRTSKKVKRYDDSDYVKNKKEDQRSKRASQQVVGDKNHRRAQDPLPKEFVARIPTQLNVLRPNTAKRKVSRELPVSKSTRSISKDSEAIRNIMPPAQAALFDSLSKASNQAGPHNEIGTQAPTLLQQQQYMAHFLARQRNSQYSLMQQMPITLPFAADEFFPLAQTHVKDNEPLNKLFPSIFKIFSKSSARYNPNIPSIQHPLLNLVYNKIGTKIELDPKGGVALSAKPQRVHLGIDNESIHAGIDCIRTMDRKTLISGLSQLLDKVNRQKNFLVKQMNQISQWYKTHVEDKESASPSNLDRKRIHSSMALSLGVSKDLVHSFIESNDSKSLLISVKVNCNGFKAPHANNLGATIHPSRELHPALRALGVPISVPEPQLRSKTMSNNPQKVNTKVPKVQPSVSERGTLSKMKAGHKSQKPVTEMVFVDRRVMFKKTLAERFGQFVSELKKTTEKVEDIIQKREKDIHDILQKNGDEYMDSMTYFNLVKLMHAWDEYTKEEVECHINTLLQPELPQREIYWGQIPTPIITTYTEIERDPTGGFNTEPMQQHQPCSSSLFSRLQSLLVEEDFPGVENSDVDDVIPLPDEIVDDVQELQGLNDLSDSGLLDLSSLSLDQRAYIQLRAAHLIDQPLLYSCKPQVKEVVRTTRKPPLDIDASINVAIRRKQKQLSHINAINNRKLEMLKEMALIEIFEDDNTKQCRNVHSQSTVNPIKVGHAVPHKFVHK